jgi:hypothetical protein
LARFFFVSRTFFGIILVGFDGFFGIS